MKLTLFMSDIQKELERVERSLSGLSSHIGLILTNGQDARSKLVGLDGNIEKIEKDVRNIRRKLGSGQKS